MLAARNAAPTSTGGVSRGAVATVIAVAMSSPITVLAVAAENEMLVPAGVSASQTRSLNTGMSQPASKSSV